MWSWTVFWTLQWTAFPLVFSVWYKPVKSVCPYTGRDKYSAAGGLSLTEISQMDWIMCVYLKTHTHIWITSVRKPVNSSNHNHHIYQTLQAGSIITYRAVFKCMPLRLWLKIQGRIVIVLECKLSQSLLLPVSPLMSLFFPSSAIWNGIRC